MEEFSQEFIDTLKDILIEGLNKGATALSQMLEKPISIIDPEVKLISPLDLPSILKMNDTATCVFLKFQEGFKVETLDAAEQGISGNILIVFSMDQAFSVASLLYSGIDVSGMNPQEIFESALGEIGNVTGSAVLNTIADKLETMLNPSPPAVITDMLEALLGSMAASLSVENNQIVIIDTRLSNDEKEVKAHFLILPDNMNSIKRIIDGKING